MITSYDKLPIGRYLQAQKVTSAPGDDFKHAVSLLAVISGRTEDDILNAPIDKTTEDMRALRFLKKAPKASTALKPRYLCGDFVLVPTKGPKHLTTSQFVDFNELSKLSKEDDSHFVELLSVILVPEGKIYGDGYDIEDVQAAIAEHLMTDDAIRVRDFFVKRSCRLLRGILFSSKLKLAMLRLRTTETNKAKIDEAQEKITNLLLLIRSGAGLQISMQSLKR